MVHNNTSLDQFNSRRSTAYSKNGVVATSHPLAAQAGLRILREGGNAFDAAVATAATLNVVEPMMTGLGGDVFSLYRTADGTVGAMRSCGCSPQDASLKILRNKVSGGDKTDDAEIPLRGPLTVTVPGAPRGWEKTVNERGRLSLKTVLSDAIKYASEGYPVTEIISAMWSVGEEVLTGNHAREIYLNNGQAPKVGEIVTLPEMAETLNTLAQEGSKPFYEGEIAEKIIDEVQSRGGLLSIEDLANHEAESPSPITTTYNGAQIYELPPNNQGLIALEALNIAEELKVGQHSINSPKRTHLLIESMKIAFQDGHHYITDPEFETVPRLNSKQYAQKRASEISEIANNDISIGVPESPAEDADTVLLTVADNEGNIVSYINSIFKNFGSGLVAGDTGITLQNRGSSFSLNPDHPNSAEPNKKPFHTLIPAVAEFGPDDCAAFGVMGGYMQPQGHLQVISNIVDCNTTLQAALDQPRWRYREDGSVAVEPRFDSNISSALMRKGHDLTVDLPVRFGGGQIARNQDGVLSGATEPRKDGAVVVY